MYYDSHLNSKRIKNITMHVWSYTNTNIHWNQFMWFDRLPVSRVRNINLIKCPFAASGTNEFDTKQKQKRKQRVQPVFVTVRFPTTHSSLDVTRRDASFCVFNTKIKFNLVNWLNDFCNFRIFVSFYSVQWVNEIYRSRRYGSSSSSSCCCLSCSIYDFA